MSQKTPTRHERQQLRNKCPYCQAAPTEWCATGRGGWAVHLHSDRPSVFTVSYQ